MTTAALPRTIRTRFLLLSDTHSHPLHAPKYPHSAYRSPLPHADVLLHAGDLSYSGRLDEYQRTFDVIKSSSAPLKIVIAGNHDRSLDEVYFREYMAGRQRWETDGKAQAKIAKELWTGEEARSAGIVYLEEGVRGFEVGNGARFTIYTTPYTPEFCHMAFPYERDVDHFNPASQSPSPNTPEPTNPCPSWPAIDILLTHGPPMHHMDGVPMHTSRRRVPASEQKWTDVPVGCANQLAALKRVRPRLGVFGHIHEGWGAEVVDWEDGVDEDGNDRKEGGRTEKVEIGPHDEDVLERGYAYVDARELEDRTESGAGKGLRWGRDSLLVNAAVLNSRRGEFNAPWVVDLDLETVGNGETSEA